MLLPGKTKKLDAAGEIDDGTEVLVEVRFST